MQMKSRLLVLALVVAAAAPLPAQVATASRTRAHVETLASEKLGGREAGSEGERLAADYIVSQLTRIGARPLPGRRDMFQSFEFTAGSRDGGSRISMRHDAGPNGGISGVVGGLEPSGLSTSVRALAFSDDAEVTAGVVFAGYGIV